MRTLHTVAVLTGMAGVACGEKEVVERLPSGTAGQISVYDAVTPAAATEEVAAAYFTVVNNAMEPDTLLGVTIPVGQAHLHEVLTESDRTRMRMVHALPVPAGGTLRLVPGGYHVMMSNMGVAPAAGDTIGITLEFARAGKLPLPLAVLSYPEVARRFQATEATAR